MFRTLEATAFLRHSYVWVTRDDGERGGERIDGRIWGLNLRSDGLRDDLRLLISLPSSEIEIRKEGGISKKLIPGIGTDDIMSSLLVEAASRRDLFPNKSLLISILSLSE